MLTSSHSPFATLAERFHAPARRADTERLLRRLVDTRWARLSSDYDDPLGMLFTNRVRQWTAGWTEDGDLYLLVWDMTSWQERATWYLYENGRLVYEETDGASRSRSNLCKKLLESNDLPFISQAELLQPLVDFSRKQMQRKEATERLMRTLHARPEIFPSLKERLFTALEDGLNQPEQWPLLDVMKLHHVGHRNNLVWLFKEFITHGFLRTVQDFGRLDRALTLLQDDYRHLGLKISPIFRMYYDQQADQFHRLITDGPWRARLAFRRP